MDATIDCQPLFLITHEFYPRRGGIATFAEEMAKARRTWATMWKYGRSPRRRSTRSRGRFACAGCPSRARTISTCQLRLARELIAARRRLRYATVYLPEPGPMLAMMLLQFFPGVSAQAAHPHVSRFGDPAILP